MHPRLRLSRFPGSEGRNRIQRWIRASLLAVIGLAAGLGPPLACAPLREQAPAVHACRTFTCVEGGIIRGRTDRREMALIFTGGDFADGGPLIRRVLAHRGVKAGFFFTGDFYRNAEHKGLIAGLRSDGHYLGPHSDKHLLYSDWEDRAKTLVTRDEFRKDILANYKAMEEFGLKSNDCRFFIPPYEWYNREVAGWAEELGLVLFNFTPGTSSNADYTTPSMPEYLSSQAIYDRVLKYERTDPLGFNGFILLIHIGTAPERTDKFYDRLDDLLGYLSAKDYRLVRIDELLDSER